ncbi:TetR family transcriptional regulator (plasmid) [Rhodococcus sp. ZPP]|uniref:TetR/AcrR family transcriptional regulator n=1 Tax=Rhodococcus sp. ZPP TaxID=2749906 RepID=UPI001AD86B45|nr:TetR/AcrR family transcriptional regulator [Rhodococcus sp. ZPP]QTJ70723.1 TetR family transcriptional regulator [Rhodococcus sp. ZPP]
MSALRERKKAALRATIVRAAVQLFMERGYDSVGMEEIAHASMCSRSTLNRHFGTKEDVLFSTVPEVTAGLRHVLDGAAGDDRWLAARRALTAQLAQFFNNVEPDLRVLLVGLWFSEPALQRRYLEITHEWEEILKRFFAAGLPDNTVTRLHTQVLASAMVSALRAVLHAAIESDDDIGTLSDAAFGMLEVGLPADPWNAKRTHAR